MRQEQGGRAVIKITCAGGFDYAVSRRHDATVSGYSCVTSSFSQIVDFGRVKMLGAPVYRCR